MKEKNEGFSLVELIVVIAIMIVLISLLLPSVIGYVRKAEITAMNANAKEIHTAVSAAMVQFAVSGGNGQLKTNTAVTDAKNSNMFIAASNGSKIQVSIRINGIGAPVNNLPNGSTDKVDMVPYLGKGFDGNVVAYINPKSYSVDCVVYAKKTSPAGISSFYLTSMQHPCLSKAHSHMENDSNGMLVNKITTDVQARDAKDGYLYGVYPQGSDTNSNP